MRQLNSIELKEFLFKYKNDIINCEVDELTIKVNQFMYFLREQAIAKRILERIDFDYITLKKNMSIDENLRSAKYYNDILCQLHSRELQGSFGYFFINEKFEKTSKFRTHYLDYVRYYYGGKNYKEENHRFKTFFFIPFTELFEWYLRESEAEDSKDYFSEETREMLINKLNDLEEKIIERIDIGNEVVFNEIEEMKELMTFLNKKNWIEIIKEKFRDLALSEIITKEVANSIVESITENKINLFN